MNRARATLRNYTLLRPYYRSHWRSVAAGLLALVAVDAIQLVIPRITKWAVDELTTGSVAETRLLFFGATIILLATAMVLFRYIWRICLLGFARRVEQGLRDRLFAHLQTLSCRYFNATPPGDLMAHATNDLESVRLAVGMGMVAMVDTILLSLASVAAMLYISVPLTVIAALPMPCLILITKYVTRRLHLNYQRAQAIFSDLTEQIRETLAGIRLVRAYGLEALETRKVLAVSHGYVASNLERARFSGLLMPLTGFFSQICLALVLYWGGRLTILYTISLGDFVAFTAYLGLLTWPMMAMGWLMNLVQRGDASLGRIRTVLDTEAEIKDPAVPVVLDRVQGQLDISGVTFAYDPKTPPALHEVTISFPATRVIALVGRTGSGKTSLCHLICRLYDPTVGEIRLDGVSLKDLSLDFLRRHIGYVPQDTFVFSGTIRDNLAFGRPEATVAEMEEALACAGFLDEVRAMSHGLDAILGERGISLSGGQKQRLALARALLTNAPIMVLDDALSAVDAETERIVSERLMAQAKGRTLIMVTHRVSAIQKADHIIVLDHGRVAETGTHAELLAKDQFYAGIYRREQLQEGRHAS